MTKSQVAKQETEHQQLAHNEDYSDKYAGEETYVDKEHTITPRATILQGLSPQVKRNNVAYVEGATPGMIFLSSFHKPLIHGEEGILFQPCVFQVLWEVRTPKESGAANFVEQRDEPSPAWKAMRNDKQGFVYYITPEGNVANQIHMHIGLIHLEGALLPYAIKFSGTGMFISKTFNGLIGSRRTETGKPAARFTFTYRMRVKSQANAMGEWGQWAIAAEGKASPEEQDIGHELREAFRKGERTVEAELPGDEQGEDGGGDGTM
jgi:hypothetical protein